MSRRAKIIRNVLIGAAAVVVVLFVAAILIVQTAWFRDFVKQKIITATEEGTGGRAEIGTFSFEWTHLRAVATDFVIHGKEKPGTAPWIHVKRMQLDLRLFGSVGHVLNLAYLGVTQPEVNVVVNDDGTTNIPTPKPSAPSNTTALEDVVDLAVGHFDLTDGLLVCNSQKQPLNLRAENLRAQLWYSALKQGYHGQISLVPLYVASGRNTPVKFAITLPLSLTRDRIDMHGARISTASSQINIDAALESLRNSKVSAHITGKLAMADLKNAGNLDITIPSGGLLSAIDLDADATFANNAIEVRKLYMAVGHSVVQASGQLKDTHGNSSLAFNAHLAVGELARLAQVAAKPDGDVDLSGTAQMDANNQYLVNGTIQAKNVSLPAGSQRVSGVSLNSGLHLDPHRLELAGLRISVLGGELVGDASLEEFSRYQVNVNLQHFDLRTAAAALGQKNLNYAGIASGPLVATGSLKTSGITAHARIGITPGRHGIPVSGLLAADYNGAAGTVTVADSYIALPHSRMTVNGSLGSKLNVGLTTTDLNDLMAAVPSNTKSPVTFRSGGQAVLNGVVTGSLSAPRITAHLAANAFSVEDRSFDTLVLDAAASNSGAAVSNGGLTRGAMQAQFAGSVGLKNWTPAPNQPVAGNLSIRNADLADVMALAGQPTTDYSGALSASVNVSGTVGNPLGAADLSVTRGTIQGEPFDQIQAQVKMSDQVITIPASYITSGAARIDLTADFHHPRESLRAGRVHATVHSTQVNLAQFRTVQKQFPQAAGAVQIQADLTGDLKETDPPFLLTALSADASARGLQIEGQNYGDFHATAQTQQQTVRYQVTSNFAGSNIDVNGSTELRAGYPTTADAKIANLPVERVLVAAKRTDIPAKGSLSGTAHFTGTTEKPEGNVDLDLSHAVLYDEPLDRVHAKAVYQALKIDIPELEVSAGPSNIALTASYDHPAGDLQAGNLKFQIHSSNLDLSRIRNVQKARPGLSGAVQIAASGDAAVQHSQTPVLFHNLDANISAKGIAAQGKNFGDLALTASTTGGRLKFNLDSNLAQASIHGQGTAELTGDYPLDAKLSFSDVTWTKVQALLGPINGAPTFEAVADGEATVQGPITKTDELRASLKVTRVNVTSLAAGRGAARQPVAIQNEGPIAIALDKGTARIDSLHLTGPQMDLQAQGTASLQTKALNLSAHANANLSVVSQLEPDVVSSGNVALTATVRGDLNNPLVNGQLELKDASVNYMQFPNGISHANGVVKFNGNSASVQNMTAESGGGKLTLAGFVAFRDELRFGLRMNATNVRVRPQQGISGLLHGNVNVSGTTESSTVSGLVTIDRVTYAPQSDIGAMLSKAPSPVNSSTTSPFLDNMKLDIRVRTATSMAVRASMADNLQADADLQIRGTASQPGILGRVSISEGKLVFFNSTYTINEGTISFYNPVRIEPILNLSLNTQAKGVDVVLKVTGPIDDMKLTYTSDPPLQFQEIVNLLATGKTPTSDPTILANQPADPPQGVMQMGESAVVSKALADPVASRLQRVFGVSQLSVDPVFTSGSDLPQARLTLQQRISNNMTFTYITALNAPNTQIIRAEFTINPQWAAMATRDENGIFSVRLTYKKQFR